MNCIKYFCLENISMYKAKRNSCINACERACVRACVRANENDEIVNRYKTT